MATEQEVMKLVAELEDKYSVPMKQMQKAVRDMAHASKAANAEAGKAAREHSARLRELHERFAKVKDFASGALTPAFATMGITAFSAGAAINSLAESLKNAGERYRVLQDTVKRGGVSAQYVGVLSKTFEGLGIDGDKANDAVARLGETFDKLNRSTNSDERNRLTALFGNALPYLDSIVAGAKSREDAITRIAKAITDESVPIDIRRKLAEGVGLPPELASRSGAEFGKSFRRAVARELAHPTNMGLLEGLSKAFIHLDESLEDFNTDMVNTFGANGIKLIEGFATATEKMTGEVQHELNDLAAIFKAIRAVLDFDDKVSGAVQNFLGYKTNPFAQSMHGGLFAPSDDKDKIKEPVKQGVIEAFRQWMFENKVTDAEKFAGGYTPMAYHPDGGGTGPAFRSGGGYSVLNGGTVPKSAQGTVDKLAGSGDKTFDIGGSGAGEGAGGMPQWYIDRLKKSEGFRSKPYWDFKQWSVGYGTRASGPNDIVTKAEAERRLGMEVAKAASYVDKLNPHLDAGTRAALTDLAYNGGPGALERAGRRYPCRRYRRHPRTACPWVLCAGWRPTECGAVQPPPHDLALGKQPLAEGKSGPAWRGTAQAFRSPSSDHR